MTIRAKTLKVLSCRCLSALARQLLLLRSVHTGVIMMIMYIIGIVFHVIILSFEIIVIIIMVQHLERVDSQHN